MQASRSISLNPSLFPDQSILQDCVRIPCPRQEAKGQMQKYQLYPSNALAFWPEFRANRCDACPKKKKKTMSILRTAEKSIHVADSRVRHFDLQDPGPPVTASALLRPYGSIRSLCQGEAVSDVALLIRQCMTFPLLMHQMLCKMAILKEDKCCNSPR